MAKTQNLSLNPTKISGTCGRLMCCLKYEQEAYEDLLRHAPKAESFVDTPEGRGTVTEVDLLRQRVKVRMEDSPEIIAVFANSDIAVLRSGKAKKNDPPIPADLAPISGSGKRVRREEPVEEPVRLDPIKFRYSTEKVVDEEPESAEAAVDEGEKKSRRRNRKPKAEGQKPEAQKEEPAKEQQPRPEKPEDPKKPNGNRRNNHRRYRKPKSEGNSNT